MDSLVNPFDVYSDLPQRTVKIATIYLTGTGPAEGVVLNPADVDRLANWCCEWDLFRYHAGEADQQRKDLVKVGGSCERCMEGAAFMLSECPYVEMNRSPHLGVRS